MAMNFKSDYRRALPSIALLPLLLADMESVWLGCAVPTFFLIFSALSSIPASIMRWVPALGDSASNRHNASSTSASGSRRETGLSYLHAQSLRIFLKLRYVFAPQWASHAGAQAGNSTRVTLYTCLAHSRPGLSRLAKRIKLTFRGMTQRQVTQSWLGYWNATSTRVQLVKATPRLLQKIYRPYQSLRLSGRQDRLNLLLNHYDFVFQQGLDALVLRASTSPVSLGSFIGKSGAVYVIQLASVAGLDREGELTLMLCSDQQRLFSIAFTFHQDNLTPSIGIGCLQGPRGVDKQERVRSATRDMFGLRPKNLMVRLVREIGRAYGCKKLILVGNQNRVLFHQVRTGKVLANYDDFWQEIGATARPDGDYQICCDQIPLPDLASIPSHKRAEARRRIELTECAIHATLNGFSRG